MKKIFISYRRSDSYDTHRLADQLRVEFGPGNVFFDIESMVPGSDWPKKIEEYLLAADILLLIIGPNWLNIQDDESGRRRIDMPGDWVRKEILTFLQEQEKNSEKVLVPVLVNGAKTLERTYFAVDDPVSKICDLQAVALDNTGSTLDFVQLKQVLIKNRVVPINPPPVVTPIAFSPPKQLGQETEEQFLSEYSSWRIIEREKPGVPGDSMRELYRLFEFRSYEEAWRFMAKIDEEGIRPYNHHPRWQNTYNRVEVWLCTFNIGHKPSYRDVRLAKIMEKAWKESYRKQ